MQSGRVTQLLHDVRAGTDGAREELLELLHDDLRRLAAAQMRGQRKGHTLQPTALVHEAYLKLFATGAPSYQDRTHFLAVAASAMRCALVDAARSRSAVRRGGDRVRVSLHADVPDPARDDHDLLDLHDALGRLELVDATWARVVELRFFGGLTFGETAEALGVSEPTVYRAWERARTWLLRELSA